MAKPVVASLASDPRPAATAGMLVARGRSRGDERDHERKRKCRGERRPADGHRAVESALERQPPLIHSNGQSPHWRRMEPTIAAPKASTRDPARISSRARRPTPAPVRPCGPPAISPARLACPRENQRRRVQAHAIGKSDSHGAQQGVNRRPHVAEEVCVNWNSGCGAPSSFCPMRPDM